MAPTLGRSAMRERLREPFAGDEWWAHQDLNLGPKDYAYHFSFRCPFPVCGLDCLLSLRPTRTVSTPSRYL